MPKKKLHLFLLKLPTEKLPDIKTMHCVSTFPHYKTGKPVPEVVGYEYIDIA